LITSHNEPHRDPTARAPATAQDLRIFLVENDPDTRQFFTMYLERVGYSVHAVATLADALADLARERYDVMIADIGLSDGTGWDLMRLLREEGVPRPRYAIAMSGFGMGADRARSLAEGFRHHLVKPIDSKKVLALLDEAAKERAAG
jgi:two-component system CheB/CheR fusion protein